MTTMAGVSDDDTTTMTLPSAPTLIVPAFSEEDSPDGEWAQSYVPLHETKQEIEYLRNFGITVNSTLTLRGGDAHSPRSVSSFDTFQ